MGEKNKSKKIGVLKDVPLDLITLSPNNPRHISEKSESFKEFAESVRGPGVVIPVHVRNMQGSSKLYELLAGEKRYRAARSVGLASIPAIDHGPISDEAAFEITFIENYQREDLTPLEHGKAVAILLDKYKGDIAAVAARLKVPDYWVRQHQYIDTSLIQEWKEAIVPGQRFDRFTSAHLALIARFPANVQQTILKELGYDSGLTVKELGRIVSDMLRLVKKAPFDTARCAKCTKRSDAQPGLWSDPAAQKVGTGDRCLDAKCWSRKDLAARKEKLAKLREKYPGLVSICTKGYLWGDEQRNAQSSYGRYLTKYDYETCAKTDPKAVPAVIVNGKGAGKIQYVKITDPKSLTVPTNCARTLKDRRKDLAEARWREAIRRLCEQIAKIPFEQIMALDGMRIIVWMAAIYGTGDGTFGDERTALLKEFEKGGKDSAAVPLRFIWERIGGAMDYVAHSIGADEQEGRMVAQLLDLDLNAEYKKICEDPEYAEPAEWANLNADGTPKGEKTRKADKPQKGTKGAKIKDKAEKAVRKCRVCGCTENNACIDPETGWPCHWIEEDLCSACEDKVE